MVKIHTDKNVADLLTKAFDVKTINGEVQLHTLVDGKKIIITESTVRRDLQLEDAKGVDCLPNSTIFEQLALMGLKTIAWNEFSSTMASAIICLATNQKFNFSKYIFESMVRNLDNLSGKFLMYPSDPIENVADEIVHKELGDNLVRTATTASCLEAEQDSGGGPRCQETMGDTISQTRFENVSKHSNDSLLARGNTLRCDKDRLQLDELMALFGLTARVESSNNEEILGEDTSKQGRIDAIDAHEEITLVSVQNVDGEMFDVNVLDVSTAGDATTVSAATTTTATITTIHDITLAQALMEIKSTKPKEKGVVIQELGESTTTISLQLSSQQSQDKGKGILIEPVKPMKKKDLIRLDEEAALKLQAEFDEEERLAKEKAEKEKEANIALIET
ncbi:hypothetical protein Tco_1171117 [Tanacetum coccineum]